MVRPGRPRRSRWSAPRTWSATSIISCWCRCSRRAHGCMHDLRARRRRRRQIQGRASADLDRPGAGDRAGVDDKRSGKPHVRAVGQDDAIVRNGATDRDGAATAKVGTNRTRAESDAWRCEFRACVDGQKAVLLSMDKNSTCRFLLHRGPFRLDREARARASRSTGCHRAAGAIR